MFENTEDIMGYLKLAKGYQNDFKQSSKKFKICNIDLKRPCKDKVKPM